MGEEEGFTLEDIIPDNNVDVFEDVTTEEFRTRMRKLVSELPEKQRLAIERRYGLNEEKRDHTLEEVAQQEEFLVTRERVRQIETKAFKILRKKLSTNRKYRTMVAEILGK